MNEKELKVQQENCLLHANIEKLLKKSNSSKGFSQAGIEPFTYIGKFPIPLVKPNSSAVRAPDRKSGGTWFDFCLGRAFELIFSTIFQQNFEFYKNWIKN